MRKISTLSHLFALAALSGGTGGRYANATGLATMSEASTGLDYTGAGDPAISIAGSVTSFHQEGDISKRFGFTLKNTGATALTAVLFGGYDGTASGLMKDGGFNDVTGAPGLVATATNPLSKIASFQQYVLRNPTRVLAMRLSTTTVEQYDQEFSIGRLDPFNQTGSQNINPSLSINSQTFNTGVVMVNTDGLQLDDRSNILYTVEAGASINIVMFCGASYEASQALAVKAAVAQNNIAMNTARPYQLG